MNAPKNDYPWWKWHTSPRRWRRLPLAKRAKIMSPTVPAPLIGFAAYYYTDSYTLSLVVVAAYIVIVLAVSTRIVLSRYRDLRYDQ
jgi:hypothetical protein